MSKVRASIDDARDFSQAENTAPATDVTNADADKTADVVLSSSGADAVPTETAAVMSAEHSDQAQAAPLMPTEGRAAPHGRVLVVRESGEAVTYQTEQGRLNTQLREAVAALEAGSVAAAEKLQKAAADSIAQFTAGIDRRQAAIRDFRELFQWPAPDPTAPDAERIAFDAAELNLATAADEAQRLAALRPPLVKQQVGGAAALEELFLPSDNRAHTYELRERVRLVNQKLLKETVLGEVTDDVVVRMLGMAQSDPLAYMKHELGQQHDGTKRLRDELRRLGTQKNDAVAVDDVAAVDRLAGQELQTAEEILDKLRRDLNAVFAAVGDVDTFAENFEAARDANEALLRTMEHSTGEATRGVIEDQERLLREREVREAQAAADGETHRRTTGESNARIQAVHQRQLDNWARITELLETNTALAREREALVLEHLEAHAADSQRRAVVDDWAAGCVRHEEALADARAVLEATSRWLEQLSSFHSRACQDVEGRHVVEEAFTTRLGEQKTYLEVYAQFRTLSDDMVHRKDLRLNALRRISRNLELQIQEAHVTLDPHKKRHEGEKATTDAEMAALDAQLVDLRRRIDFQRTRWRPIEDQLEEARVDFEPPDLEADRAQCQRKAEAIERARAFVVAEQELVDRDALSLRKLKTYNTIAQSGHDKRRNESRNEDTSIAVSAVENSSVNVSATVEERDK